MLLAFPSSEFSRMKLYLLNFLYLPNIVVLCEQKLPSERDISCIGLRLNHVENIAKLPISHFVTMMLELSLLTITEDETLIPQMLYRLLYSLNISQHTPTSSILRLIAESYCKTFLVSFLH
ncbi:hypothetical protein NPIL_219001 [Nephila pilipes]|uniref:Uncharacterized protein n=1 Tax=Nephila pilipes TaxID=299642 RepID=A0A8X6QQL7_NEPPI|nr:hypothetical protein NPIL_219001 [Nephila pilipes]